MTGTMVARVMRGLGSSLVLLALAAGIVRADEQPGSPIHVEVIPSSRVAVGVDSATAVARAVVGSSRISSEVAGFVKYEDRASFGPPGQGSAWLFRATVEVRNDSTSAALPLNVLVDATSGRVQAVFTDPGDSWVLPVWPVTNPQEIASTMGWAMDAEIPDGMQASALEAIAECWKKMGVDPTHVPQLIVRPRWIAAERPAHKIGGKSAPVHGTERVWLIQVCGMKYHANDAGYDTGWILQFVDGALDFERGFYVP